MSVPSPPDVCRQFVEMAFERVGMSIWWEGSNGVGNHGIINRGSHMGKYRGHRLHRFLQAH